MRSILLVLVAAVLLTAVPAISDTIYGLILQGRLQEARDSLSAATTASLRDGNRLFYQSLLEPDADRSVQLMQAALRASVSPRYREEIYLRLAQYSLLTNDLGSLGRTANEYRARWEAGRYRGEMLRLSILAHQKRGDQESALKQADRFLLEYSEGEPFQWGTIDKARIMIAHDKQIGAHRVLRKLTREKSGPGVPQSLYLLALEASKADDAVFYYNILREEYPAAVGLDALADKIAGMSSPDAGSTAAERKTGTFYSVQVGVFSQEDNAKRQARAFSRYDRQVDISKKVISGQEYRVVYVGRFSSYLEAQDFKKMLEANHNEVFQVVAR